MEMAVLQINKIQDDMNNTDKNIQNESSRAVRGCWVGFKCLAIILLFIIILLNNEQSANNLKQIFASMKQNCTLK